MSTVQKPDYDIVLDAVRAWPTDQQFSLVQDVLKILAPKVAAERPHQSTLDQARGLLTAARPAPTDAEIATWLDERRTERFER